LVSIDGQNVLPLTLSGKPYGNVFADPFFGRVAYSPDGKRLVFLADNYPSQTFHEIRAGVTRVIRDQGEAYTGFGPAQIWIADLDLTSPVRAASNIRRLTDDETWYADPQWTPDGQAIICAANKSEDVESVRFSINKNYDLWRIDVATGEQRQLTTNLGPDVSPRVSPDGKTVAYLSVPRKGPHADVYNLATLSLVGDRSKSRVLFDHHGPDAARPPHPSPSFPLADQCWEDNESLVFAAFQGIDSCNVHIHIDTGVGNVINRDAGTIVPVPPRWQARQEAMSKLAPPVKSLTNERLMGREQIYHWKNENLALDGVITLPPPEVAKPPYAMIVNPHGGPHSRSAPGFNFNTQVFASQGYLVFAPNFRGTPGYGKAFLDADRGDFGGGDMRDILTGIDALVKDKLVDPDRQFVYGVSYGGFMTTWLVGHTKQFKAAVAQNAVTDLNVMWGMGDLQSWIEYEFGGRPWEVPEKLRKHSPITYVDQVDTPTLILHSKEDRRCPIAMGHMFHQGLVSRGVTTDMVIYPNENHGIKQPAHQADVLKRVTEWFRRFDPVRSVEIVTLGDSITKAARPGVRKDETFAARLEVALVDRGLPVRVTNVGIGGERTDLALARLDRDVIARRPKFVTIMYGTNDSYIDRGKDKSRLSLDEYRANLKQLVERLRAEKITPVLMTEPRWGKTAGGNDPGQHPNDWLEPYMEACREVAKELDVPLVDHYDHWKRAEAAGQHLGTWTTDQCHPNATGQRVLFETMLPIIAPLVKAATEATK